MTFTVFLAVLGAGLLHAGWNAIIKTGGNKQSTMMIFTIWQGITGLSVLIWRPLPGAEVWPWLIAAGLIHMSYQLFLAYAYEQGDLSRVYPIARGAAPLIVLLASFVVLPDVITVMEFTGVIVLGCGIAMMAGGALTSGESRKLIPFALGAACATAAYTIVDGIGARISGDPVTFVCWLLLLSALCYVPAVVALKGPGILVASGAEWRRGILPAVASMVAFSIAVWAMTIAPIPLVAALRETSILFAVLIGVVLFGEKLGPLKAAAAALIVVGVGLTRF